MMGHLLTLFNTTGVGAGGVLPAPENLALSITGAAFDVITATWDAVAGATDYEVEYSDDGVTYTPVDTTALLTYDITSADYVLNVDTHYVRVRAVGGDEWATATIDDLLLYLGVAFLATRVSGNWVDAISGITATQSGTIGTTAGLFGTANRFEETNGEYFTIAAPPSELDIAGGDYSVVATIRALSNVNNGVIFDKGYANGGAFYLDINQTKIREFPSSGAAGIDVTVNTWTQVAEVITFSGPTITYYRNTNPDAQAWTALNAPLTAAAIGGLIGGGGFYFDGDMNQLLIYKGRALTSGKIARLYNGGSGLDVSTLL